MNDESPFVSSLMPIPAPRVPGAPRRVGVIAITIRGDEKQPGSHARRQNRRVGGSPILANGTVAVSGIVMHRRTSQCRTWAARSVSDAVA